MSPLNPPNNASDALPSGLMPPTDELSRRRMLQIMGATMALGTAAGCRWEGEDIVPFQVRPEGRSPGTTRRFSTAIELGGTTAALLVTSYDGRPIKIEGNPDHPLDGGAASARAQAAVLDLYDPDHSSGLVQTIEGVSWPRTWTDFGPWFDGEIAAFRSRGGKGLAILAEASTSSTFAALAARFTAVFPDARWCTHESVSRANEFAGATLAFGRVVRPILRLERARTLVCLDADLFTEHPAALALARAWAKQRDPKASHWLETWVFESTVTPTGACADQRIALRAEQMGPFLAALEESVRAKRGAASGTPRLARNRTGFLARADVAETLDRLATRLAAHPGESVIAVGPRQGALVHALAHRLNGELGNAGSTIEYVEEPERLAPDPLAPLADLVAAMSRGEVEMLLVLGGNPVYTTPPDLDFTRALARVKQSLHLSHYRDETSRASTWHLPRAHALESWGDALSWDGTRCTTQPLIDPIFERATPIELLARIVGAQGHPRDLVRASVAPGASDSEWKRVLHDGFVRGSRLAAADVRVRDFDLPADPPHALEDELSNGRFELVIAPDPRVFDGRSANNAWLQELPDPVTKVAWGNAARFGQRTAEQLSLSDGAVVRLSVGERALEVPVVVVPGAAEGSVTLHLGYGRTAAGVVGGLAERDVAVVGHDANRLRTRAELEGSVALAIEPTGASVALSRTQDSPLIDAIGAAGRDHRLHELLRVTPLAVARSGAEAPKHETEEHESLWHRASEDGRRFGMAIDLNACTGCNACVIACQAENNIPVVGAEQVRRGRVMHWLRIDRYFTSDDRGSRTDLRFQPVTCQHCESAPCEQVCPVAATVHSSEGLNDMVYNRCVGTRYCANNCPFKVRRFNYFNYRKDIEREGSEVQRMLYNPEVTIRSRGVMEKCTFCVQRIQQKKIAAKNAGRALQDGEIVTACQQTCPTEAIVFGDLADPKSRVARLQADRRAYAMLAELNIRPRTAYLAKVVDAPVEGGTHGG